MTKTNGTPNMPTDKVRKIRPAVMTLRTPRATPPENIDGPMIEGVEPRGVQLVQFSMYADFRNSNELAMLLQDGWEILCPLSAVQVHDGPIIGSDGKPPLTMVYQILISRKLY